MPIDGLSDRSVDIWIQQIRTHRTIDSTARAKKERRLAVLGESSKSPPLAAALQQIEYMAGNCPRPTYSMWVDGSRVPYVFRRQRLP